MAVTIKKKELTIVRLVERLFPASAVAGGLLSQAKELEGAGFQLVVSPLAFKIVPKDKTHTIVSSVPLKLEAVTLAMKGKLGTAVKQVIRDKVSELITDAYNFMKAHYGENSNSIPELEKEYLNMASSKVYEAFLEGWINQGNKVKAIKAVLGLTNCPLKEAKDQVETWIDEYVYTPEDEKSEMVTDAEATLKVNPSFQDPTGTPVALMAAVGLGLHQPVFGTSEGSRYHVIAISPDTVVATRIKDNHNIAIRAVSESQHIRVAFQAAGMKKCSAGHYSIHLEPDNLVMAKKCIGAILFAIGAEFTIISDRIEELVGVGK